jgi:RNA polymerase sigma-70 factor, ECF subfamily
MLTEARWAPCDDRTAPAGLALGEVVATHGRALYERAKWLTRSHSDACDLVHDTIERAMRSKRQTISRDGVLRWLLAIMHNRFLDLRRTECVQRRFCRSRTAAAEVWLEEQGPLPLWRMVDDEMLGRCIDELPADRATLLRMFLGGAGYAELEEYFGVPSSTIGTRLLRARRRLAERLQVELSKLSRDGSPR